MSSEEIRRLEEKIDGIAEEQKIYSEKSSREISMLEKSFAETKEDIAGMRSVIDLMVDGKIKQEVKREVHGESEVAMRALEILKYVISALVGALTYFLTKNV